jgi:hypothetical protein
MARPIVAFYITICVTMFVLSKIVVSYLLYRKWAQKRGIIENSLSGNFVCCLHFLLFIIYARICVLIIEILKKVALFNRR